MMDEKLSIWNLVAEKTELLATPHFSQLWSEKPFLRVERVSLEELGITAVIRNK